MYNYREEVKTIELTNLEALAEYIGIAHPEEIHQIAAVEGFYIRDDQGDYYLDRGGINDYLRRYGAGVQISSLLPGCILCTIEDAAEADQTAEKLENAREALEARNDRSAWDKGVTAYALELLEQVTEAVRDGYITAEDLSTPAGRRAAMLNGAADWSAYSWGGSALPPNSSAPGTASADPTAGKNG